MAKKRFFYYPKIVAFLSGFDFLLCEIEER